MPKQRNRLGGWEGNNFNTRCQRKLGSFWQRPSALGRYIFKQRIQQQAQILCANIPNSRNADPIQHKRILMRLHDVIAGKRLYGADAPA